MRNYLTMSLLALVLALAGCSWPTLATMDLGDDDDSAAAPTDDDDTSSGDDDDTADDDDDTVDEPTNPLEDNDGIPESIDRFFCAPGGQIISDERLHMDNVIATGGTPHMVGSGLGGDNEEAGGDWYRGDRPSTLELFDGRRMYTNTLGLSGDLPYRIGFNNGEGTSSDLEWSNDIGDYCANTADPLCYFAQYDQPIGAASFCFFIEVGEGGVAECRRPSDEVCSQTERNHPG